MSGPRSRIPLVLFGLLVGAVLGVKTVVLLGFVLGMEPSLEPGVGLALGSAWVLSIAVVFALFVVRARTSGKKKPVERTGDGVRDVHLDG